MNIKDIKSLAQIMEHSGLTAIEVSEGDSKIRLEKNGQIQAPEKAGGEKALPSAGQPEEKPAALPQVAVDFNHIREILSPMVGVFYTSPTPDAEPFVKVGDKVKKGDVVCIIEAMKLMNEITSEYDGEIIDICAHNGQVVEFSQILFKVF